MQVIMTNFLNLFGIQTSFSDNEIYAIYGVALICLLLIIASVQFIAVLRLNRQLRISENKILLKEKVQNEKSILEEPISWHQRLASGLERSRKEVWSKLTQVFNSQMMNEEGFEQLEEILYGADIGPETVTELLSELRKNLVGKEMQIDEFKKFLFTFLHRKIVAIQDSLEREVFIFDPINKKETRVIMIVGVNGVGKTTTIGKLATRFTRQGAKVIVGACDTFRAAAVDQLQIWCDRAGAEMVRAKDGANPSGVAYESLEKAIRIQADYCILDTAGRLHTKGNLMEELAKTQRVLKKLDASAPHQTLLVLDAITGQNALRQAEEFHRFLNLSGLIFTKCDGSSKAGSAIAIVNKLRVPISYVGVGESVDDLNLFQLDDYLHALLDIEPRQEDRTAQ